MLGLNNMRHNIIHAIKSKGTTTYSIVFTLIVFRDNR